MKKNLHDMRKSYEKASLSKKDMHVDPIQQFEQWFNTAKASINYEANAMHLSTVTADGQPEGRIVLLKAFSNKGFVFFTHYTSDKGRAIASNNKVALTFHWAELEQQVRIEGMAVPTSEADSDHYFYSRPIGSQIGAVVSPQSQIIENYAVLEDAAKKLSDNDSVKRPEQWGGYCVEPVSIEFWQGRPNRLHDRIKFTKLDNTWRIDRLAP